MREAVFVPASRLYDVESGTAIARPATQASDEDIRRALEGLLDENGEIDGEHHIQIRHVDEGNGCSNSLKV